MIFLRRVLVICLKDLRTEWRTKQRIITMAFFSFLMLLVFNFSLEITGGNNDHKALINLVINSPTTFGHEQAAQLGDIIATQQAAEHTAALSQLDADIHSPTTFGDDIHSPTVPIAPQNINYNVTHHLSDNATDKINKGVSIIHHVITTSQQRQRAQMSGF